MNLAFFKFVFVATIKRKSLLVTWLILLVLLILILFVVPVATNTNSLEMWAMTATPMFQSFLGLLIALFTAILAITIFKDQREDGTDLIVISRKITKTSLIVIKLLVFALICLMVTVSCCLLCCFCFFAPSFETKYYGSLIAGMLVGNLVSFFLFGSIAILASTKINKLGIILINVLLVIVSFAYQMIGWITFGMPLFNMQNDNVVGTTYVIADRENDGSYKEKHVVNLLSSAQQGGKSALQDIKGWEDVKNYWTNQNFSEKSNIYTATNLSSQLGLSYLSCGLNDFSQRQASRIFGFSSFYNYKLMQPASPELTDVGDDSIDWVYTGYLKEDIEILDYGTVPAYIPYAYSFPGIQVSDYLAVFDKTYQDKIPIGSYKPINNSQEEYIYLEKNDLNKYSKGFKQMYDNIFKYDLKDKNGNRYYDLSGLKNYEYQSAWCKTTQNLAKYYDLVWSCLNNKTNLYLKEPLPTFNFDIKNIDDLNQRFIQFKYFTYLMVKDEQKNLLRNGPKEDEMVAYNRAIRTLQPFQDKTGIQWVEGTWYMTSKTGGSIPVLFLDRYSLVPAFPILLEMIEKPYETYDYINCSFANIMKCADIYNNCVANEENYLFCTLNDSSVEKRSNERRGHIYTISNRWLPAVVASYLNMSQNWNLFYYDTIEPVPMYIYPVIWAGISIMLFGLAGGIYKKYDIQ